MLEHWLTPFSIEIEPNRDMSKLSRIGGNQISEATALPGWKVQGNGSLADKFTRIVDDKAVAMNMPGRGLKLNAKRVK